VPTLDHVAKRTHELVAPLLAMGTLFCGQELQRTPPARPLAAASADPAPAAPPAPIGPPAQPALAPLDPRTQLWPLVVSDYRDAVVSIPTGATDARPIVVALHGNFDRPEWQCEVWRGVTRAYPFILCPRGVPRTDAPAALNRWTYGKPADVRREIDAALAALRLRFGDYVANGPIIYIGFSLGAILGVGIVSNAPDRFPRVVLIEGGQTNWSAARAKAFASSGGKRVLFACGQRSCKSGAQGSAKLLDRAGVETKSVYGGEVGHTYDGPVAEQITQALPWLVADDPQWAR
jgi:predicted esterase